MTVMDIVKKFLKDNGYDGLFNVNGECACPADALCQCDECFAECEPGYRVEGCTCGQGCDYHIVRDKPDDEERSKTMGNLSGYIMVGPKKLDPIAIEETIREVTTMLDTIKKAKNGDEQATLMLEAYGISLQEVDERLGDPNLLDPRVIVEQFVVVWDCEDGGDMMFAPIPGLPDKKVGICRERTAGDELGSDIVFRVVHRAWFFYIPDMLKIGE